MQNVVGKAKELEREVSKARDIKCSDRSIDY